MKHKARKLPINPITNARTANAFVLGVIFNQAQKAEKSWKAPEMLFSRLNTCDPAEIRELPLNLIESVISQRPVLHRFVPTMARYVVSACNLLTESYNCDARNIWSPPIPLGNLINRFTNFLGIGSHKATVAIFLLTVELGISVIDDGVKIDITKACPSLSRLYGAIENPIFTSSSTLI